MIAHLQGTIAEKTPTRTIVDVHGVGFDLLIPITTFKKLDSVGESTKLLTYLHVREDALQLFGFSTAKEKWLFLSLISVSGVGPKLALSILSGCNPEEFRRLVTSENITGLTRLSGVGKKTAQRLVIDLKEKMAKLPVGAEEVEAAIVGAEADGKFDEAVLALMSLGYNRNVAEQVVTPVVRSQADLPLDEIIKKALQSMQGRPE